MTGRLLGFLVIALVIVPTAIAGGADRLAVSISGTGLPRDVTAGVIVDQDIDQPDMAITVVGGPNGLRLADRFALEDDVVVVVEPGSTAIFKGEIVAIEPLFGAGGTSRVIVRAFNRLHRLTRGQKTREFTNVTDAAIVTIIALENGLAPALSDPPSTEYEHVFQHNQTDLEFLRVRAARLGFEVWVEDTKLFFGKREPPPPVSVDRVKTFHPRLSSSETVQKVIVRGWDPDRLNEFVGTAVAPTISLDPDDPDPSAIFGRTVESAADRPIFSIAEANAIAKAKLEELLLNYITGEAAVDGDPELKLKAIVTIDALDDRFDGQYLIAATKHRYSQGCGGYKTAFKIRRNSEGGLFHIPSIDDEVLVAFEHGDLRQPVIVGSFWDTDDACTSDGRRD